MPNQTEVLSVCVHDLNVRFGCILVLLLSQQSHLDVYDVKNVYIDCVSLCVLLSGAVV